MIYKPGIKLGISEIDKEISYIDNTLSNKASKGMVGVEELPIEKRILEELKGKLEDKIKECLL